MGKAPDPDVPVEGGLNKEYEIDKD